MSTRASFYQAEGLDTRVLSEIAMKMRNEVFKKGGTSGFLIEKSNSRFLSGRYIERLPISEIVIDPFGVETSFERFDFKISRFELRTDPESLVVFSPFSLMKTLIGRLAEFSDFKFSLVAKPLVLKKVIGHFSREFSKLRVYAACIEGYRLSNSTSVKMLFDSSDDVRQHVSRFIKSKDVNYFALKFEFEAFEVTRRCEIREAGSVTIFGESDPALNEKVISLILAEP